MKKGLLLTILCVIVLPAAGQWEHPYIKDCSITKDAGFMSETWTLRGSVKVITDPEEHADFRVKVLTDADCCADVRIKLKEAAENITECGEWRFVSSEKDANFTIRFVTEQEHFTVRFVHSDPGSSY